jgi:hypothetical protein
MNIWKMLVGFFAGLGKFLGIRKKSNGLANKNPMGFTPKDKGGKCHDVHVARCFRKRNKAEWKKRRKDTIKNKRYHK